MCISIVSIFYIYILFSNIYISQINMMATYFISFIFIALYISNSMQNYS